MSGDVNVSLTDSDGDSQDSYYVYFQKDGDSSWTEASGSPFSDEGSFTDFFWDASSLNGDYTLNVTNSTSTPWKNDTVSLTIDNNGPSASLTSPSQWTNSDSPTVEVTGSDSISSVENVSFSVLDSGSVVDSGNSCNSDTCSSDASDLSDGSYDVNYTVFDIAGNSNSGNLTFNVDTTQDFVVDPDFSETGAVLWDSDYAVEFSIESNSEAGDLTVSCQDGEGDTIDTYTLSSGSTGTVSCDVPDDYADSTVDVTIEVCDRAGNCDTSDAETFTFDASSPTILESSTPGNVVNGEFPVEFTASDASGIDSLEYFYDDSSISTGSGTQVDLNSSDGEFMASVNGIDAGQHTVYFRVQDNAGRWSSTDSLDIDYRPDAEPEITMEAPSSLSVKAGQSTGLQVTVRNTGDIFISSSDITASAEGVFSETKTVEDLDPSNASTVSFTIDTSEEDLGKYDLELSATNPQTSKTVELVVEATESQRQQLDTRLSDYESKLQQLQQKIDSNRGDLADDLESRFDSNFTEFKQKVEEARSAKQNGDYYKVSSALEGIDSDYQSAQSSFENVKKIDDRRDRRRMIMIGAGAFFLLLLAAGGIYYYENEGEFDFDLDFGSGSDSGGFELPSIDELKEKLSSLAGSGKEEAEEFEWDGFKD